MDWVKFNLDLVSKCPCRVSLVHATGFIRLLTKMSCNFPWRAQLLVLVFPQAVSLFVKYSALSRSGTVYHAPLTT